MGGRPATASLSFKRGAAAVAFDVHLEDGGMMNQAVDDGDRHCLVWEDLAPFAERLIGSDEERSPLVPGADEFKEHAGFGEPPLAQAFDEIGQPREGWDAAS